MGDWTVVTGVFRDVSSRFTWVSDLKRHGVWEDWRSYADQVERGESFQDDCDGFAMTCAELLVRSGIPTEAVSLATCQTETGEHHLVCIVIIGTVDVVMDNRQAGVKSRQQLLYTWDKRMWLDEPGTWYTDWMEDEL